jgi:hypothetical protein
MSTKSKLTPAIRLAVLGPTFLLTAALFTSCGGSSGGSSTKGGIPTLTSLNPPSVEAGSASFELTVNGTNFDSSCEVQFTLDGELVATFPNAFVSKTELQALISASDVAQITSAAVIVGCQDGGGFLPFQVTGFPRTEVEQAANDLVWDPIHQFIYLSVPPTVPGGSGIAVFDPVAAKVISFTSLGNNPDVLAISDDGQFLYVGLDDSSSIQRFTLPQMAADIQFPIGAAGDFPFDIQVAPGAPHTIAVSIGVSGDLSPAVGGVTVFDDGVPRATSAPGPIAGGPMTCFCSSLQWGSAANGLYSNNNMSTGFDFYSLTVDSSGVALSKDFPSVFRGFNGLLGDNIHYLSSTGFVYADDRTVVDASSGAVVTIFDLPASGIDINRVVPDSSLNLAVFLSQANNCNSDGNCYIVSTFQLSDFNLVNSLEMSQIESVDGVVNMIRWGKSGLAFNTDSGQIYLVDITTLLQPASNPASYQRSPQGHLLPRIPGRILTTTRKRFPAATSNEVQ